MIGLPITDTGGLGGAIPVSFRGNRSLCRKLTLGAAAIIPFALNRIDREWPHQIAVHADRIIVKPHDIIDEFCHGVSLCRRGTRCGGMMSHTAFSVSPRPHAERFAKGRRRALRSEGSRSRQRVVSLAQGLSRTEARSSPYADSTRFLHPTSPIPSLLPANWHRSS